MDAYVGNHLTSKHMEDNHTSSYKLQIHTCSPLYKRRSTDKVQVWILNLEVSENQMETGKVLQQKFRSCSFLHMQIKPSLLKFL